MQWETFEPHGGSKHKGPFLLFLTLVARCAHVRLCENNGKGPLCLPPPRGSKVSHYYQVLVGFLSFRLKRIQAQVGFICKMDKIVADVFHTIKTEQLNSSGARFLFVFMLTQKSLVRAVVSLRMLYASIKVLHVILWFAEHDPTPK